MSTHTLAAPRYETREKFGLVEVKPDVVLVHGDITTTMATLVAVFYLQIPVGHVEAGLRTYNIYSPFQEEINRRVTGRVTKFHFFQQWEGDKRRWREMSG